MDSTERLAAHALATPFSSIPSEALADCRKFLLDSMGVIIVGSSAPWARELSEMQNLWGSGDEARNWAFGTRMSAPSAAMVNAYQLHNSEFDCVHEEAVVHPMAVTLPALMAVAEREGGVSGRDFLLALVLGVDVACHIGVAANGKMRFFRPATAGAFGAVAAIGRLRGFSTEMMRDAMGIVYSQLCGTMQAHFEGSSVLAMQIGFNSRNAVIACDMAATGIKAPRDMLEGPFGYYTLFEGGGDLDAALQDLGKVWRITEVAHKPFPSGRATHGVVDSLLEMQREVGFSAEDVASIEARVPPLTYQLVGRLPHADMTPNQARLCASYAGARAMMSKGLGVADFDLDVLKDPTTLDLARRIVVKVDGNPDPNDLTPVTVETRLQDGRSFERTTSVIYGNPAKPMTESAHLAKFRNNWQSGATNLPRENGERLITAVTEIEQRDEMRSVVDLLVP